jgi:hypothetical protein
MVPSVVGVLEVTRRGLWHHAVRRFLALALINYGVAKLVDIPFNPTYQPATFERVYLLDAMHRGR